MRLVASLVWLVIAYALGILVHFPLLRRNGSRRDYLIFLLLVGLSLAYSCFLIITPDKVPNPTDLINSIVMGFGKNFFQAK